MEPLNDSYPGAAADGFFYGVILLRASREERGPEILHELSDDNGPTVLVARVTNGPVIGVYTKMT